MNRNQVRQFLTILNGNHITTVYQPIVSLQDGTILGYEALSRITHPVCTLNIEELFHLAAQEKKLWELEKLCRQQALKNAAAKPTAAKLFINVDANIIHDSELKSGFTRDKLQEYGLNPNDIIFEITEKSAIHTMDAFTEAIQHYQKQQFKIAIDDFGSGYSGLNRVCSLAPNYLKIDMELIRRIDQDVLKKSAVGAMVNFCKEGGIRIIAEGIETKEEVKTLIRLGVDYGQGYYFAKPTAGFCEIDYERKLLIKEMRQKDNVGIYQPSVFGKIDSICTPKAVVLQSTKAVEVFHMMQADEEMTEVCVVDHNHCVCGILTRSYLIERFSGQFGYNLRAKRTTGELMTKQYLAVERHETIDEVALIAMNRQASKVYDAVIVTDQKKYVGVVTVKNLLTTAVNIQVKRAIDASPLTGLPGNSAIQNTISSTISGKKPFAIIYLDLDNFKAYNDAYGFTNGDMMIQAVAETMKRCCAKEDFKGHIGGDDFVIITADVATVDSLCQQIIKLFMTLIEPLYSSEDWQQGYIISRNRNGFTEQFAIATLSIAAVTNGKQQFTTLNELSQAVAETKKRSKKMSGNSVVIV